MYVRERERERERCWFLKGVTVYGVCCCLGGVGFEKGRRGENK